jgi:hypothetical protein
MLPRLRQGRQVKKVYARAVYAVRLTTRLSPDTRTVLAVPYCACTVSAMTCCEPQGPCTQPYSKPNLPPTPPTAIGTLAAPASAGTCNPPRHPFSGTKYFPPSPDSSSSRSPLCRKRPPVRVEELTKPRRCICPARMGFERAADCSDGGHKDSGSSSAKGRGI